MGFLDLFIVALIPVIEVLLITGVGLFLALDSVNLLGPDARHSLNNLVFFVFCPALVISNLAETITSESLVSLWFMPVNILLTFIIGSALAWFLVQITKTPPHLHGLVIGCCSAGNLGNLLLIIIPAVCQEANSPFGDSFDCSTYGEAYASLSMAVGAIYIWSYVYIIMRVCANKSTAPVVDDSVANIEFFKESSERFLESCKQSLPPSMHCAGTDDNSGLVELPGGTSSVKRKQHECSSQRSWNHSVLSKEDMEAIRLRRQEAKAKREPMKKYSNLHQERAKTHVLDESVHIKETGMSSFVEAEAKAEPNKRERVTIFKSNVSSNLSTWDLHGTPHVRFKNLQKQEMLDGPNSPFLFPRRSFCRVQQSPSGHEGSIPNSPGFPTYMAVTASAKAKARSMSTLRQRLGSF